MKKPLKFSKYDFITIQASDERIEIPYSGPSINISGIKIEFEEKNDQENLFLTAFDKPVEWIKIRWNHPLPKQVLILGDAWERGYGDFQWKGISGRRFMPWYFLASDKTSYTQWGYGVKCQASSMCFWQADTRGITLVLDVRCGGDGVLLHGRRLKAAELVCALQKNTDAYSFAKEFCKKMCSSPVFPPQPVYGSNNWYYAYGNSSEQEILKDADYLAKLTKEAENPPYMVIDDCWQEHHRLGEYNGGPWKHRNKKFPNMKKLAEKIKEKGVHPGIWVRLLENEDEEIKKEWRLPLNGCLDPTHPDALAYIKRDIARVCEWGYQLIKHDFSTYDLFGRWGVEMNPFVTEPGWHFYDRSITSAEAVKNLYQAIYDTASKYQAIILGCNTIGHLGAGFIHINRTGDDTSGLRWERTRTMGINSLAFRLPQHKTFFDIDADCVGITGNISWYLNKQWADVLAESGTPLFLSIKPGILNEKEFYELKEIMLKAATQSYKKIPVDWQETDCPEIWEDENSRKEYFWYEESGSNLQGNNQKYYANIPLS